MPPLSRNPDVRRLCDVNRFGSKVRAERSYVQTQRVTGDRRPNCPSDKNGILGAGKEQAAMQRRMGRQITVRSLSRSYFTRPRLYVRDKRMNRSRTSNPRNPDSRLDQAVVLTLLTPNFTKKIIRNLMKVYEIRLKSDQLRSNE